jgi:hypothetical protein
VAGVLGGTLFVAWGYIDRPNLPANLVGVVQLLSIVAPVLFLMTVVGLCVLRKGRLGAFGWTGLVLSVYGCAVSVAGTVVGADSAWWSFWAHFAPREWSQALHNWLLLMLTGLTLTGIATSRGKPLEAMGPLALATGAFGLGYYFTDTGAVFEARSVHIGFGLLFSMGLMTLGAGLLMTGTRRSQSPQARATSEKSSSRHLGE